MKTPTTLERIRKIVEAWKREDVATRAAMDTIDGILIDQDAQEQRLKTISEDARRDREVQGL